MTTHRDALSAGEPLVLPSGRTLLLVSRTRTVVQGGGGWQAALVRREPHALLLRDAAGQLSAVALGLEAVSLGALSRTVPDWERVVDRLGGPRSLAARPPAAADRPGLAAPGANGVPAGTPG